MKLLRLLIACGVGSVGLLAAEPPEILRWRHYEVPLFPAELASTMVSGGFATVVFTFDVDGKITDRIVVAASHPAFVVAVYEAVREWEVDTRELAHFIRRETIRFEFERHRFIVTMTQRDASKTAFSLYGDHVGSALRTLREAELHPVLATVATALPEFPATLGPQHARGTATIGFVIDVEGRVRVPAVTDATEPEFGEAALAAIKQWRFAPPRQDTVPVQVFAERTFRFGAVTKAP